MKKFLIALSLLISLPAYGWFTNVKPSAGTLNTGNTGTKSTQSLSYYVDCDTGNDANPGTSGSPFATVQYAVNIIPDIVNHDMYIYVDGTCSENDVVIKKLTTTPDLLKYFFIRGTTTELLAEQTADGGDRYSITDTGAFAGEDYSGNFIEILAGPNFIDLGTYYWFSNYYPIISNTDDVLTLPAFASAFTNATEYRIVENTTIIDGDGTAFSFGISNFTSMGLEVHVQNLHLTQAYYGFNNWGRGWAQGNSCEYDSTGYSCFFSNVGGFTLIDGNYVTGVYTNADVGCNYCLEAIVRQNAFVSGKHGVENDSGNYFFLYGNVIDTMSHYGLKAVNSGIIKGSDNSNTRNEISNCSEQAFYAVNGGKINMPNAVGSGNNALALTIAASDVYYDSSKITGTNPDTFSDVAGRVVDKADGSLMTLERTFGSDQSLVAADAVVVANYRAERVAGSGGAVTLTSTPSVEDGLYDGQELKIQGTSDANTITFQDESNLANSGLQLSGGVDMTVGQGDFLYIKYDSGDDNWYEISRSDN